MLCRRFPDPPVARFHETTGKRELVTDTSQCVLLANRHHGLNERVCGLLEETFGRVFVVLDEASLLDGASRIRPTMFVIDLSLAAGRLASLVGALRERAPEARIVLISVHDEPTVLAAAAAAGADAVVLKRDIATDLLPTVDDLIAGRPPSNRFVHTVKGDPK
ncbi:MAG: hypothetical protein U1F54_20170 [Burkholderiales bacterium]